MRAPAHGRGAQRIVIGKIMVWDCDGQSFGAIPFIFRLEGQWIIFGMAGEEDLAAVRGGDHVDAGFLRFSEDAELGDRLEILASIFGVAGVGSPEGVVEAAEESFLGNADVVLENSKAFLGECVLRDAVAVKESGLSAPADVEGGGHHLIRPVHEGTQFVPVVDLGEVEMLYGGTGDDETVEGLVADLVEAGVVGEHVLGVDVAMLVGEGLQQGDVDLQWGVAQKTKQLGFGRHLGGHEVEDCQAQGADVLPGGLFLVHDKNVFPLQGVSGRECARDFNGHVEGSVGGLCENSGFSWVRRHGLLVGNRVLAWQARLQSESSAALWEVRV